MHNDCVYDGDLFVCILQHERIFKFPADHFYKEKRLLSTNPTTAKEMRKKAKRLENFWPDRDPTVPFVFCDVIGTEKVTDTEFIDDIRVGQESKFNPKEAEKIVRIIKVHVYQNASLFSFCRLKL